MRNSVVIIVLRYIIRIVQRHSIPTIHIVGLKIRNVSEDVRNPVLYHLLVNLLHPLVSFAHIHARTSQILLYKLI